MEAERDAPSISVVMATAGRPQLLRQTLDSIVRSEFDRSRLQVVVVDNLDDERTRAVCAALGVALPLTYVVESEQGKNAALNRGLEACVGELIAFIDDDVVVEQNWLAELARGSLRWPSHHVFGGRVLPRFPEPCPAHLAESRYQSVMFTTLDRGEAEGPDPRFLPFGPNMAIRRGVFVEGWRYDPSIGPKMGASYIMGSETELLRRLRDGGYKAVYLPRCVVHHQIRPEQLKTIWMLKRGVRYGKSVAFRSPTPRRRWFGAPPRLYRRIVVNSARSIGAMITGKRSLAFDNAMDVAIALGEIAHHRNARDVREQIGRPGTDPER